MLEKNYKKSDFYHSYPIYYQMGNKNTHIITMKVYERKYRQLSEKTKEKIRKSMTGKKKSTLHRKRISESLRTYWGGVKSLPYYNNESDKSSNLDV